jgi:hypothetical protein
MSRDSRYGYASLWLTVPIAVLLAMAAGAGIFVSGLYRDPPGLAAQAIGQDVISLFVALPALLISAFLAGRGSYGSEPWSTSPTRTPAIPLASDSTHSF